MPDGKSTFGSNPNFFVDGEIIDRKGNAVDPGECIIFKVTDAALVLVLGNYVAKCQELGSPVEHQKEAMDMYSEVSVWQYENKDRVKAAD